MEWGRAPLLSTATDTRIVKVTTYTTRNRRQGEEQGKDYHFISKMEFDELRKTGDILVEMEVDGNYYATRRSSVDELLHSGKNVLLDINFRLSDKVCAVYKNYFIICRVKIFQRFIPKIYYVPYG